MATTIPALRGRFGTFEYYLTTMHVGELIRNITIPKDIPGWADLSIEEQYQRDINVNRVKKEIAPYFAHDPSRFSGALILAVMNDDGMAFEALDEVGNLTKLPQLYKSSAQNIGFVTLSGGEIFVPLDGQHRAKALQYAMSGMDDNNVPISGLKANTELAAEDLAVILVRFESRQARRIFSKVNRYAKPTNKGENLITDDDDPIAVLTRALIGGDDALLLARLVRHKSNTLNAKSPEFITLATFYEANKAIIEAMFPLPKKGKEANEEQVELWREEVARTWRLLFAGVELFAEALRLPNEDGDDIRSDIRKDTLLGKPVAQLALVHAYLLLVEKCKGVAEEALIARMNRLSWDVENPMWHGVLMNPNGRVMSGRRTVRQAGFFIAYMCGAALSADELAELINYISGEDEYTLPEPVA